ncbi:MAG: DUF4154 domain-containing protein [Oligoflexia bacterium]|nr:DUF4154 domain-containing protein [Oligoflexia bacterium]
MCKLVYLFALLFLFVIQPASAMPKIEGALSPQLQAVFLAKALAFYTNSSPQVTVAIVGDGKDVAAELKKTIGLSKVKEVRLDAKLPVDKPDVIFLVDSSKLSEVTTYTSQKRILSSTSMPELVEKGISLSFGVVGGKPRIILNKGASEMENVRWNPVLLNNPLIIIADTK